MTKLDSLPKRTSVWPELPLASWAATASTLDMWPPVVGKVRLALSPHVNHWWEVPLYVSARRLSASVIPYDTRRFDVLSHNLEIRDRSRATRYVPLYERSVGDFYHELMAVLRAMSIHVVIWSSAVEIVDSIPFPDDTTHAAHDAAAVGRFHRMLMTVHSVVTKFRAAFVGKVSPGHFSRGRVDSSKNKHATSTSTRPSTRSEVDRARRNMGVVLPGSGGAGTAGADACAVVRAMPHSKFVSVIHPTLEADVEALLVAAGAWLMEIRA